MENRDFLWTAAYPALRSIMKIRAMKPMIPPALRRLWRDRSTVQLGVDPQRATTLEFADPQAVGVLGLFDGTRTAHRIARDAHRYGIDHTEALTLIDTLCSADVLVEPGDLVPADLPEGVRRRLESEVGALSLRQLPGDQTPAAVIQRRRRARVLVSGRGRMVTAIAALLGAAGVGRLELDVPGTVTSADVAVGGLLPGDVGRPRGIAAADAVRRAAPDADVRPLRGATPDLAILVGVPRPAPSTALRYARRRCPHLTVWPRDGVVVLGPLVRPGQTACLDCLNLHRQSRDPQWPLIAAQLATSPDHGEPAEAGMVAFGAGLAALHALCHLDGGMPESIGGTVELSPFGRVRRREWSPHPRCGCVRRSARWTMTG